MKTTILKKISMVLCLLIAATSIASCSQGETPQTNASTTSQAPAASAETKESPAESKQESSATPTSSDKKISIMLPLFVPETPQPDTPVWLKLNELTGVTLDFQFVPSDSYKEKLNISIAAGQLPHAFATLDSKENTYVTAARSGMFWPVGDAVAASENLSLMPDSVMYNASIDGTNYFIPRTRTTVRSAIVLRKDWLENVGLDMPENMDELYEVIKAFATQDPDGNQIDDTYGLITSQDDSLAIWSLDVVGTFNGAGKTWVEQDGQLVPVFETEEYIDVIKWYKRLYDEKLINQDFATIKREKGFELLNAEQGGLFIGNSDEITNRFDPLMSAKQAENPDLELEDIWAFNSQVKSPDGSIRLPASIGFAGGYTFPKTTLKTEEEFQEVFDIFDIIASDEARNVIAWGIEGVNYEMDGEFATSINLERNATDVSTFNQLSMITAFYPAPLEGVVSPMYDAIRADSRASTPYGISDPTYPFISETYTSVGAEILKLVLDATTQWVMGEIDEDGYLAAIEQWKASGGQKIIDEMNEAYSSAQ